MSYRGEEEEFLFIYKREGHHLDIEKMKESHDDYKKLAVCLGLSLDREFIFKGAADFCQKKSSPEAGTEAGTEASAEAGPEAGAEAMPEQ
uniref:saxitoxin and tetrodotoxin-binding protein 1-like n=1 Tax=Semicossyphus pulcher TaxID=241346 RepID=UPI0037E8914E